jgi:hypothetical protein
MKVFGKIGLPCPGLAFDQHHGLLIPGIALETLEGGEILAILADESWS